jgi:hypothetical protein
VSGPVDQTGLALEDEHAVGLEPSWGEMIPRGLEQARRVADAETALDRRDGGRLGDDDNLDRAVEQDPSSALSALCGRPVAHLHPPRAAAGQEIALSVPA